MSYIKGEDAIKLLAQTYANSYARISDALGDAEEFLSVLPSADVIEREAIVGNYNTHEWCTDCKEYDQENHRCPRWNNVIRSTIEETYQEGMETAWGIAQTVFGSTVTLYEAMDVAKCMRGERQ